MKDLIISLPDLNENDIKIRSNFFKTAKNGKKIEGLEKNSQRERPIREDEEEMIYLDN